MSPAGAERVRIPRDSLRALNSAAYEIHLSSRQEQIGEKNGDAELQNIKWRDKKHSESKWAFFLQKSFHRTKETVNEAAGGAEGGQIL